MIYCLMILATIVFATIAIVYKKKENLEHNSRNKIIFFAFAFLSFLIPFSISAFRDYTIGTDTSGTYMQIFNSIQNGKNIRDFGFGIITKLALILSDNYTGFLVVTSLIFCGLSYKCIFRDSENQIMSILLFFTMNIFFISMNMVRQCIATSVFIFAIKYIKNKNLIKYIIAMIIAFSIHTSAILYVPMYFIYNLKINKKMVYVILIFIIFLRLFLSDVIIEILMKFSYFRNYFAWYLSSGYNTGKLNIVGLLIASCILAFLVFIYKFANDDKEYNILLWNQTIVVTLLIMSSEIPLMQRTSYLFTFPLFIYLPNMFKYISNSKKKVASEICINVGYLTYMFVTIFVFGYNEVYPYKWIF